MDIKYTTLDTAMEAVKKNGLDIKYCSPELICNLDLLKTAVKQNYYTLREIRNVKMPNSNDLIINNKELMFEVIKTDVKVFRDIGSNLKDDEEIVLYVVSRYGSVLKEASKRLQNNKKILLTALSNSIYALDGAKIDDELKNDKEVALLILKYKHNRINIKWFGNKLKQELIDSIGYDITIEPQNEKVIEHVKNYLKCKIEGKPFVKPESPFKKEEVKEVKEEVKQEVKIEPKIEEKIKVEPSKPVIKEEALIKENTTIESKNEVKNADSVEFNIEQELARLNMLKEAIQKNIFKTGELETQLNMLKKENEQLKEELNSYANNIKKLVLDLKNK